MAISQEERARLVKELEDVQKSISASYRSKQYGTQSNNIVRQELKTLTDRESYLKRKLSTRRRARRGVII